MVKLYVRRILEGAMSISDVPLRWRDAVGALLPLSCGGQTPDP